MSAEAFDVCVIGSGAGGGPVAAVVAEAGYSVVVVEKGPWYVRRDFLKDEIVQTRRDMFTPSHRSDPHVWEKEVDGKAQAWITKAGWNALCVGGSTNIMSGYFLRMKPLDFRVLSEFGEVEGATVADWPISYDDLAPFYDQVEHAIGVSGVVVDHPWTDARQGPFPYPPLPEHGFAKHLDETCRAMGLHSFPVPRAVLSDDVGVRNGCNNSGWCGSYGCTTGAKGSSRETVLPRALATKRATLRFRHAVQRILTDESGRAVAAEVRAPDGDVKRIEARLFVVACSAIETARLLLLSRGPRHPDGLANGTGLVGRNLIFSTFAGGAGDFPYDRYRERWPWLDDPTPWVNRAIQDHYVIDHGKRGRRRGGTLSFLRPPPSPIQASLNLAFAGDVPLWGWPLKKAMKRYFRGVAQLHFEVFGDYTPTAEGRVVLDAFAKDAWGFPSARARFHRHPRDRETVAWVQARGAEVLRRMGAEYVLTPEGGYESSNLVAGTCRFGDDPATSVLDPDCRAWEVDNLYVTDGSFMPTGGTVPYTFTIYANAFRVADKIVARLGGPRKPVPNR